MTKTQDVCRRCSKTINGRQQYIACTGTCNRRFHCRCVNIAAAEYELLVQNGVSTYECHECTKLPGLDSAKLCSDDVHCCVDPSGDAGEEQPEKEEGPGDNADLRTIILQLCRKVDALSSEVQALRADNEQLHLQLARNAELLRDLKFPEDFRLARYPQYKVINNEVASHQASTRNTSRNNSALFGVMVDITLLAESDILVCTLSSGDENIPPTQSFVDTRQEMDDADFLHLVVDCERFSVRNAEEGLCICWQHLGCSASRTNARLSTRWWLQRLFVGLSDRTLRTVVIKFLNKVCRQVCG
ncbi:hypothetical protein ISCGN_016700 [Ixodes scapularis]